MYCGKLLLKEQVSVDHIIPIHRVETEFKVQKFIKMMGWKNGNDVRNLGASCGRCNRKKSSKMGVWVIRGIAGRSVLFQNIRIIIRIAVVVSVVYGAIFLINA